MIDFGLLGKPQDFTGNALMAFEKGRQTAAVNQAGQALASGNSGMAQNALLGAGMVDQGLALQDRDIDAQDRQRTYQRQDRQEARQVTQDQRQATAQDFEMAIKKADALGTVAKGLRGIPFEQREAAFTNSAQQLASLGFPPDFVKSLQAAPKDDVTLDGFITSLGQETDKIYQFMGLENGGVARGNQRTGEFQTVREPGPEYKAFNSTDTIVDVSPGRGGGGADGSFGTFYQKFLAPQEGGYNADDGNGAPVNFGINQKANPDVDVASLQPAQAAKILEDRYWKASGADKLPPGLAEVHGDTAVNMGVGAAQQLLSQSGGDPKRYLELREQRYRQIAERDPSKARYLNTWLGRNKELGEYIGRGGGGGPRVIREGAPKQGWRPSTAEEKASIGLGPDDPAQTSPEGKIEPFTKSGDRKTETDLRKEFNQRQEVKDFKTVETAFKSVKTTAAQPTAAGDLSLIFAYMKLLDPTSVVREQEFANAQNAAGVPDQIRNQFNRIKNGERLNPRQRADFVNQAEKLYASQKQRFDSVAGEYRGYAEGYGVDPNRVVVIPGPASGDGEGGDQRAADAQRIAGRLPGIGGLISPPQNARPVTVKVDGVTVTVRPK